MGINKVFEVMVDEDKARPGEFITVAEVKAALEKKGFSNGSVKKTYNHLLKLTMFKMVDMKGKGVVHHIKTFKLHKGKGSEN